MSENITLDRIDFEKITRQAKAARAVYLRRYIAAVVGGWLDLRFRLAGKTGKAREFTTIPESSGEAAYKWL